MQSPLSSFGISRHMNALSLAFLFHVHLTHYSQNCKVMTLAPSSVHTFLLTHMDLQQGKQATINCNQWPVNYKRSIRKYESHTEQPTATTHEKCCYTGINTHNITDKRTVLYCLNSYSAIFFSQWHHAAAAGADVVITMPWTSSRTVLRYSITVLLWHRR